MGTDTTPPDPELSQLNATMAELRQHRDRVSKAVANDNTNGAPRPEQAPDPAPDAIILPPSSPR